MALLVLLALGSAVGWFAAIMTKRDSLRESFLSIALGAAGAIASLALLGEPAAAHTIHLRTLGFGLLGAVVALLLAFVLRFRRRR